MKKESMQTKIIAIFVIMVLIVLSALGIFSYFKMKLLYEDIMYEEFNTAYMGYIERVEKNEELSNEAFFEAFALFNSDTTGMIVDEEFNPILVDKNIQENITLEELKDLVQTQQGKKFIEKDGQYIYVRAIKDTSSNIMYYIIIQRDASFIVNQLNEYIKIIVLLILVMIAIAMVVSIVISRNIVNPINKLRRNLDDVIEGNTDELDEIALTKRPNEVNDLVAKFKILNGKVRDNLTEISSQKSQIETILRHMSDGVMAFDVYGNLIYQNPAAIRLLNLNVEHKKFNEIFNQIKLDVNLEKIIFLQDLTSSEKTLNIGETYVNMYFEPFKNEEDVIGGLIVLIQDITKQVKLDEMRKEFVANVSHELKTPITIIMGYSEELVEDEIDNDMRKKFASVILNESQRMARLVSDLLQLSKFDLNKDNHKKTEFDLGELTKKVYNNILIEAKNRGHEMECYVTADVPNIYADKEGLEQVILNIVSNSIKYTPDNGNIKIYVGYLYNYAYVKVIDNGIGISKADLSRVFERFYRVDKAHSREQGGTGLGLAIAKEIIERNNGSIDISSTEGKGTEVIIRIPVNEKNQKHANTNNNESME